MCGRYTIQRPWAEIFHLYNIHNEADKLRNMPARHNVAPTQDVPFMTLGEGGHDLHEGRWWLVPHWAKELQSKYPMFNARSEEVEKKPSFRDAFKTKRCLIPADGYYEWTKGGDGGKDPHYIHLPDNEPFSFAGLWAHNTALDVTSCTILTAAAVPEIEHLHKRMPVILPQSQYQSWLNPSATVEEAKTVLNETRGRELVSYRVDRAVNSSRATGSELITPV